MITPSILFGWKLLVHEKTVFCPAQNVTCTLVLRCGCSPLAVRRSTIPFGNDALCFIVTVRACSKSSQGRRKISRRCWIFSHRKVGIRERAHVVRGRPTSLVCAAALSDPVISGHSMLIFLQIVFWSAGLGGSA